MQPPAFVLTEALLFSTRVDFHQIGDAGLENGDLAGAPLGAMEATPAAA